jgi:peptidylprolyl isomerase
MRSDRSRRSALALAVLVPLGLAACGGSDSLDTSTTTTAATATTVAPAATTTAPSDAAGGGTDILTPPSLPAPVVPPKPTPEIPTGEVTQLTVRDLVLGEGDEAVEGSTVVVHYVGVRSADGTEFDNSYDRGQPLPVTLGAGRVIAGWDEGLVGVRAGGQRQLDIPADLAYGDNPQGDVIQAGDALTFVVDVIAVIPPTDAADAPDVTVAGAANVPEIVIDDLVEGDGDEIEPGENAVVHIVAFRADTGEQIDSTWESGSPFTFRFGAAETLPGLELGVDEMRVGGRRQVTIPFVLAFGDVGNEEFGLPPQTDMVLVIDLIAAY